MGNTVLVSGSNLDLHPEVPKPLEPHGPVVRFVHDPLRGLTLYKCKRDFTHPHDSIYLLRKGDRQWTTADLAAETCRNTASIGRRCRQVIDDSKARLSPIHVLELSRAARLDEFRDEENGEVLPEVGGGFLRVRINCKKPTPARIKRKNRIYLNRIGKTWHFSSWGFWVPDL